MKILKIKDKEIRLNATMKKIAYITQGNKGKNLRDTFFKAQGNVDFLYLARIIMSLAEDEQGNNAFGKGKMDAVYDFMEKWVNENNKDYQDLFKEVAEEINDKSFFGKKISKEEMEALMNDPLASFDINQVIEKTAQSVIGEAVAEEWRGFKG